MNRMMSICIVSFLITYGCAGTNTIRTVEDGYFNGTTGLPVGIHSVIYNRVLWARSETFGYADIGSFLNPKHEIRNPKQYPMIQILMIKTRPWRYKFKHYV